MNSKQRKTLNAVFVKPACKALEWSAIESLLRAVGCVVVEGEGSRVRFAFAVRNENGSVISTQVAVFHRPHPCKEAKAYQIEQARDFLKLIGVKP